jgi:hypothetical protein
MLRTKATMHNTLAAIADVRREVCLPRMARTSPRIGIGTVTIGKESAANTPTIPNTSANLTSVSLSVIFILMLHV